MTNSTEASAGKNVRFRVEFHEKKSGARGRTAL
jgi:hypothetical protein